MNFNRVLALTFVILLVILGFEGFFLINTNQQTKSVALPKSTIAPSSGLKILYQAPGDKEGRTIIYQDQNRPYPGVGESYDTESPNPKLINIIGVFKGWEKIEGTKDRYLLLENPITKKPLAKSRVCFESSPLFDGERNCTALSVENLKDNQINSLKKQTIKLANSQLDKIFKKGDLVIALPRSKQDKDESRIFDDNDVVTVSWLIIRRQEGLKPTEL